MVRIKQHLSIQEKLLIFINYCLPEINYTLSYSQLQQIFRRFYKTTYSLATLQKELSILKKRGLIPTTHRYHHKIPSLTNRGRLRILPRLPFRKFDPWDGKWRMVIFSLPEKERPYRLELQKKLAEMSFKKIQKGVYISPPQLRGAINRLSNELGIRQYMTLAEADRIDREKSTIQKIWKLNEINAQYQQFIKHVHRTKRGKFWPLVANFLEMEFAQIYRDDPQLPKQFLPSNWRGEKAYQIYRDIIKSY